MSEQKRFTIRSNRRDRGSAKFPFDASCTVDLGDHRPLILTVAEADEEEDAIQKCFEDAMERIFPQGL